jgi:hypothetical protein
MLTKEAKMQKTNARKLESRLKNNKNTNPAAYANCKPKIAQKAKTS